MSLEHKALAQTDDLPIRHEGDVHSGKVRSMYWLTPEDSARIIAEGEYDVHPSAQLGIAITSDRLSAFDVNWKAEEGLDGVPGKGACLNADSEYWFGKFEEAGLAPNHILDTPHALAWLVQRAQPVMVEGIARQYITGSMWRAYERGEREFCGIALPDGLQKNQKLDELLITPSTKGTLDIPGLPDTEDAPLTRKQIEDNYEALGFRSLDDVALFYDVLIPQAFQVISDDLDAKDEIFVDTKFEVGYFQKPDGSWVLGYIDEAGTPDSSRMWDKKRYEATGEAVEKSKEGFRGEEMEEHGADLMTNKDRYDERKELAATWRAPVEMFGRVTDTYVGMTRTITGSEPPTIENARAEIIDSLTDYGIIEQGD